MAAALLFSYAIEFSQLYQVIYRSGCHLQSY